MDAIPGLPTYFIFTPITTTEEYRQKLKEYPEWQVPADPDEPDGPQRWEAFEYELACAELCGKGHYSMRRVVEIVSAEEYAEWAAGLKSTYKNSIRGTDADPFKGDLLGYEKVERAKELKSSFNAAMEEEGVNIINLEHVFFKTGSADLDDKSFAELDNLSSLLNARPSTKVELGGHTDNTGDDQSNLILSQNRASSVMNYLIKKGVNSAMLVSRGYGETSPRETNDTEEGRALNRRTELKILSK